MASRSDEVAAFRRRLAQSPSAREAYLAYRRGAGLRGWQNRRREDWPVVGQFVGELTTALQALEWGGYTSELIDQYGTGTQLRELRNVRGITQDRLAVTLDVDLTWVKRIERRVDPSVGQVARYLTGVIKVQGNVFAPSTSRLEDD